MSNRHGIKETKKPTEGVFISMKTDVYATPTISTACEIRGKFVINGSLRHEFEAALTKVFETYRI